MLYDGGDMMGSYWFWWLSGLALVAVITFTAPGVRVAQVPVRPRRHAERSLTSSAADLTPHYTGACMSSVAHAFGAPPELPLRIRPPEGVKQTRERPFICLRGGITAWAMALALLLVAAPLAATAQATPATQSSVERGVTIKVTPKAIAASDSRWEFSIVLDTHSADLSDDLVQSTNLRTADGRTLKPLDWTGAPPGGHHREGVLAFDAPVPRPASIELSILRPGESAARTYRWQL